jgi:hypothetical protein
MKKIKNMQFLFLKRCCFAFILLLFINTGSVLAQDSTAAPAPKKIKPVKNTFGSVWLIDNQTVMVSMKGTLEFDIHHRFGIVNNGAKDLWGFFAPSNMQIDVNAKYALLQQTPGKMPVSITWFGNVVIDSRNKSNFREGVHRLSYFNQLMIARKITEKFSAQVAPSFSWFNNVEAYVDSKGNIQKKMKNGHLAISVLGRYKISDRTAVIAGYDQPLTQHATNNPHPNICFGLETTTSSHAFQVFAGNYYGIVPQSNNMYNQNDYRDGQFVIGFNMTRLWNF